MVNRETNIVLLWMMNDRIASDEMYEYAKKPFVSRSDVGVRARRFMKSLRDDSYGGFDGVDADLMVLLELADAALANVNWNEVGRRFKQKVKEDEESRRAAEAAGNESS